MAQRIVTLLFTDIEGSTRLWEEHGDTMREALREHDAALRTCVETAGGEVFKTVGDGFFCVFESPTGALQAAVAAQSAMNGLASPVPGLRIRCAIHSGSVEERAGDYFGIALSRASRMLDACHGGQTLISEAAKALAQHSLPAGAWLVDHGPQRLRDLEVAESVFELRHPDLPEETRPLRTARPRRDNLPSQITNFVGRVDVVQRIENALQRSRLVTLTGTGGSGKTRLALHIAQKNADRFADGAWFVDLGTLSDESLVAKAACAALNVREQPGYSLLEALVEYCQDRSLLLILDNCEHLLDECGKLSESILKSCPKVVVLATSREALGIQGEVSLRVPSLGVPSPSDSPERIRDCESVQLFLDRALLADPSFQDSEPNLAAIARIVQRLDGIPLAIELAAARVSAMTPDALATRLDESFRVLTGGARTSMPRQQTLAAMIDWSYSLLTDAEQAMLRRLSVFSGGWTIEAAEEVCADGDQIRTEEVLDLLSQLVRKSLVLFDDVSTRYRLLETVRWFALQRLNESGDAGGARNRHSAGFLQIAEGSALTGPNQVESLERLEQEHDNLLAALGWCQSEPALGEDGLRFVAALGRFWYMHGHFATGTRAVDAALAHPGAAQPTKHRAEALIAGALLRRVQGDLASAEMHLEEAMQVYRGLGDDKGLSTTLNSLGNVMREGGRYAEAQEIWNEALALRTEMGDRAGIAVVRGNLGIVAMFAGDYESAEAHIQASLAEERALQRRSHEGIALSNLGLLKLWQGDLQGAKHYCSLALEVNREVGTKLVESRDLHHLAQIEVRLEEYEDAKKHLVASLDISHRLTAKELIADAIETTATLLNREKRFADAATLMGAAERIRAESGCAMPPNEQPGYEAELGKAAAALGSEAGAHIERGRAMRGVEAVEAAFAALGELTHSGDAMPKGN